MFTFAWERVLSNGIRVTLQKRKGVWIRTGMVLVVYKIEKVEPIDKRLDSSDDQTRTGV